MRFVLITLALAITDLISKYFAEIWFRNEIILSEFFRLAISKNQFLAFSLPMPRFLQLILSVFLLIFLGTYLYRRKNLAKMEFYGGTLIFGGALGNLYERVFYCEVTDFIDFSFWPSFNLADSFICIGVFLIILADFAFSKAKK